MLCQQYFPSPHLRRYIAYYWIWTSDVGDRPGLSFNLVPDGYVDWVFHLKNPWSFSMPGNYNTKKELQSHIFGQIKNYIEMQLPVGELYVFGIKFQPWAAHVFWGINMCQTTNKTISLFDLLGNSILPLEEKIHASENIVDKIKVVELFLENKINHQKNDDLEFIVNSCIKNNSPKKININIGERRLQQRFKSEIGISPKLFKRTVRVNRVIGKMIQSPKPHLTDLAYQFNYFDQSHFIREFQQFTGFTPSRFLQSINPSGDVLNLKVEMT